ncbi:MAG: DUF5685 family protein [Candidatus Methanoplasma sp.]|jgi:hypothetical protein|nr:DUF5685 family protein [Candidatus Methanoplasma sp.]
MFGYVVPMYSRLSASDLSIYRRYYCEGCHQLKAGFGILSTAAVNYDMTFNAIVLNSASGGGSDVDRTKSSPLCVLKRPSSGSEIMRRAAAYTVTLTKWELEDDRTDHRSLKSGLASLALSRAIMKAEERYPEYDRAVGGGFKALRSMEEDGCSDAVLMGRTFGEAVAKPLASLAEGACGEHILGLMKEVAAMVYVMDAVDDLDEDYMNDTFNPYLQDGAVFRNKAEYISRNIYGITSSMRDIMKEATRHYGHVRKEMGAEVGVADNIMHYGIPDSAKKVLSGDASAKASLKNILFNRRNRYGAGQNS